ncbi:MAG: hypothetical protein ACRC8P_03310 [Spiroplasma sp.]
MKLTKKLAGIVALGTIAIASTSVVACGNSESPKNYKSWDLDAYNKDGIEHKIWIAKEDKAKDIKSAGSVQNYLAWKLWTGIIDADDKDGDHSRQEKRFREQEVAKHLLIDVLSQINLMKELKENSESFVTRNLKLSLDKDLITKIARDNEDYILKASEATLKEITVILI